MAASATSSRTRSNGHAHAMRSLSPSGKFCSSSLSSSSSALASFRRSISPTRVNLYGSSPSTRSVRFSLDRPTSPSRSISFHDHAAKKPISAPPKQKRTCMCSPTTHPGSFRCTLHKGFAAQPSASPPSNRLNARRSAMTNSLVRIGTVEGDLVKRALAALIRPSSHHQRRRAAFQPRPSRLSIVSMADD